ncbi:hypothetical protein ACEPPN_012943 [Leptodophora sp. 'Broadleaf-Isolate-01']
MATPLYAIVPGSRQKKPTIFSVSILNGEIAEFKQLLKLSRFPKKTCLVISLLCNVEHDRSRDMRDDDIMYMRPRVWRAPSWSWAAVEGPVTVTPLGILGVVWILGGGYCADYVGSVWED